MENQAALTEEEIIGLIQTQIKNTPLIIYMKGTPEAPQCGFSQQAIDILIECGHDFGYMDVLANSEVRALMHKVSDWPTFPQVFLKEELLGGADIIMELHQSGELQKKLDAALVEND